MEIKVSMIQTLTRSIPAAEELTKQWGSAESPRALRKVTVCLLHWQATWWSGINGVKNNHCLFSVYGSGIRISHSLSHLILMIHAEKQYNMGGNSVINKFHWCHSTAKPWPTHLLALSRHGQPFVPPIGSHCLDLCNRIQGGKSRKDRNNNNKKPLMDSR